jgi:hypothetical protein
MYHIAGKLDGIFLADVWGGYDVFNGNLDAALASGAQFPCVVRLVPQMLLSTDTKIMLLIEPVSLIL